jgi:hypothetical protein
MLNCYWIIIYKEILYFNISIRLGSAGYLVHRYPEGRPCPSIAIARNVPIYTTPVMRSCWDYILVREWIRLPLPYSTTARQCYSPIPSSWQPIYYNYWLRQNLASFTKQYASAEHPRIAKYLRTRSSKYKHLLDITTQGGKGTVQPIKKQKFQNTSH